MSPSIIHLIFKDVQKFLTWLMIPQYSEYNNIENIK